MSDVKTITVIGAGIGGFLLVAHLGSAGHKMRLHDIDDAKLADLRARGGVDTEGLGKGFSPTDYIGTDLAKAVNGADIVIVNVGGHRQSSVAKALAPLLRDGQIALLIQGNTGGSLVFRRVLDEAGCKAKIDLAEMDNYPYSARKLGPAKMKPIVTKRWLQIATFPGHRIDAVFATLGPLFPTAVKAANILYTGFMNANAMLHVVNCMANATKIERGETYQFYAEGVTNSVARVYQAISDERVKAAAALGAKVPTMTDWFDVVYKVREPTWVEAMQKLTFNADGPYGGTPTPKSLDSNFVAEDVPVGLMPMVALGKAAGVAMPAMQTLIDFTSLMTGDNYAKNARTLERMGLAGKDATGIRKVADQGFG
jgi:opine dehydrogenase